MPRKYTRHPVTPDRVVKVITSIRGRNNRLWMALLRLALKSKPRQAKAIVGSIVENDQEISRWLSKL